jgi:hypothetical protein
MKALLLLGMLSLLLLSPAPAWGQPAAAFDGLASIADTQRYRAAALPTSAQQCRERDRSFLVRNRLGPSRREEALASCLAVAQKSQPVAAPAAPNPATDTSYAVR